MSNSTKSCLICGALILMALDGSKIGDVYCRKCEERRSPHALEEDYSSQSPTVMSSNITSTFTATASPSPSPSAEPTDEDLNH